MQIMLSGFIYLVIFHTSLAEVTGGIFNTLLSFQNSIVKWMASFRFASLEHELSLSSLYISYAAIIAAMITIKWVEERQAVKNGAL